MNFLEKLDFLLAKNNLNKAEFARVSEIPYTTIDGFYKKGYDNLKMSTLRKIATAFDCTLDYLILDDITTTYGTKTNPFAQSTISDTAQRLASIYDNELNEEGQRRLTDYADDLVQSGKYKKGAVGAKNDEKRAAG